MKTKKIVLGFLPTNKPKSHDRLIYTLNLAHAVKSQKNTTWKPIRSVVAYK